MELGVEGRNGRYPGHVGEGRQGSYSGYGGEGRQGSYPGYGGEGRQGSYSGYGGEGRQGSYPGYGGEEANDKKTAHSRGAHRKGRISRTSSAAAPGSVTRTTSSRSTGEGRMGGGGEGRMSSMSRHLSRLRDGVRLHLNDYETVVFRDALNAFNGDRSPGDLAASLGTLLNTPAKRLLIPMVRNILRPDDAAIFDSRFQQVNRVAIASNRRQNNRNYSSGELFPPVSVAPRRLSANARKYSTAPVRSRGRVIPADLDLIRLNRKDGGEGYGFSLREAGSRSSGVRGHVVVGHVEYGSEAEREGLREGDDIVEVNDIDFTKVSHGEGLRILEAANSLDLLVRHPSDHADSNPIETHSLTYVWVDTRGRPASPPTDWPGDSESAITSVSRRSGLSLLQEADERKVNLQISKTSGMGLTIRGGSDYGLGVFITGVDSGSAAQEAGIKIGDQILDVNGQSFMDITHRRAVRLLRRTPHMVLTLKYVGKLPSGKVRQKVKVTKSHHQREPAAEADRPRDENYTNMSRGDDGRLAESGRNHLTGSWARHQSGSWEPNEPAAELSPDVTGAKQYPGSLGRRSLSSTKDSVFFRGVGSQLMMSSLADGSHYSMGLIREQARSLLNPTEQTSLGFYLGEYEKGYLYVNSMVQALCDLFNTQAKFSLLKEIRQLVHPPDLKDYDLLVAQKDAEARQKRLTESRNEHPLSELSLESLLLLPSTSSDKTNGSGESRLNSLEHSNEAAAASTMLITDGESRIISKSKPESARSSTRKKMAATAHELMTSLPPSAIPPLNTRDLSFPKKAVPKMGTKVVTKGESRSDDSGMASGGGLPLLTPSYGGPTLSDRQIVETTDTESTWSDAGGDNPIRKHQELSYSVVAPRRPLDSEDEAVPGLSWSQYGTSKSSGTNSLSSSTHHQPVVLLRQKDQAVMQRILGFNPSNYSPPVTHQQDNASPGRGGQWEGSHHGNAASNAHQDSGHENSNNDDEEEVDSDDSDGNHGSYGGFFAVANGNKNGDDNDSSDDDSVEIELKKTEVNAVRSPRKFVEFNSSENITIPLPVAASRSPASVNAEAYADTTPAVSGSSSTKGDATSSRLSKRRELPLSSDGDDDGGDSVDDTDSIPPPPPMMPPPPLEFDGFSPPPNYPSFSSTPKSSDLPTPSTPPNISHPEAERLKLPTATTTSETTSSPHPPSNSGPSASVPPPPPGPNKDIYAVVKRREVPQTESKSSRPISSAGGLDTPAGAGSHLSVGGTAGAGSKDNKYEPSSVDVVNRSPRSSSQTPMHERAIRVNKSEKTLGIAIEGGSGTPQPIPRVITVQTSGSAHGSGLSVGHLIVKINEKTVEGLTHVQAARAIAEAFRNRLSYMDFTVLE